MEEAHFLATNDDGDLEGEILLELLNGSSETLTLLAAFGIMLLSTY